MAHSQPPEEGFPVKLTRGQRKVVAELAPALAGRLKLDEPNQRTVLLTPAELKDIQAKATAEIGSAGTGARRNSLRHILDQVTGALDRSQGIGAIAPSERLYQFRITLKESSPPIWRRILVKDCTLDRLHEHIQTAMGWTNSHLHDFRTGKQRYGDPLLMEENFEDMEYRDSTTTKLSDILPKTGGRFRLEYVYDFGDNWEHDVLFEGYARAEPGGRYPVCVEGARACPPEDVGGIWGYAEFLEAIRDEGHEQHDELLEWIGGEFDPEAFDPAEATRQMHRGLPNWRDMM
jgi:hypothetical protein